jgi:hypothetical protein
MVAVLPTVAKSKNSYWVVVVGTYNYVLSFTFSFLVPDTKN